MEWSGVELSKLENRQIGVEWSGVKLGSSDKQTKETKSPNQASNKKKYI